MRRRAMLVLPVVMLAAFGWASAPAASQSAAPAVTFHKDVVPVLQKNCQSCHRPGQIGPFSMLTYKETRPWARAIKQAVVTRAMPPWFADPRHGHFNNDRSLTQAEIDLIASWVDAGAPEGHAADAPRPVAWPEGGWQIPPDVAYELPPYPVPATGIVEWERIAFAAPFTEDTWVTSVEILPSVPAVVHHLCFGFQKHRPTTPYGVYQWMDVPRDGNGNMLKVDGTTTGPRKGIVEWERIAFPAPFKEDTWVTSVEILPSVPAVVHHLCFGFQKHRPTTPYGVYQWMDVPRDGNGNMLKVDGTTTGPRKGIVLSRKAGSTEVTRRQGSPDFFHEGTNEFCYLPGLPYEDYRPVDAGMFVPAGSDMIVSLHYTTTGLAVVDKTRIGFTVSKRAPKKKFLPQDGAEGENPPVARQQANASLAIPPFADNHPGPVATIDFNKDVELVWFRPHAHVRGKSVRYTLIHPDGREETVLSVPNYNFNWQLTYRTSIAIRKGSKMRVQFTYDNSTKNKYNPDPSAWVRYGGQSWEEMGTPNMGFLVNQDEDVTNAITER